MSFNLIHTFTTLPTAGAGALLLPHAIQQKPEPIIWKILLQIKNNPIQCTCSFIFTYFRYFTVDHPRDVFCLVELSQENQTSGKL